MSLDDDAVGADDQQASQGSFAHSGRGPEPLLATGRMLSWHQTKRHAKGVLSARRRKIAGLAEGLGRRGEDRDGRDDQRTNARHCHRSSGHVILFGSAGDLGVELPVLRLQMGENRDEHLERGNRIDRQNVVRVLDNGDQFRCVGRPLRHNLAKLGQVTTRHAKGVLSARRVDRLRTLISNSRTRKTIAAP